MKFLLFLCLPAIPLSAQGIRHVKVRVIAFEKAGTATAFEAAQPDCDESLYASLTADTAAGRAKRVQDQTVTVRGGQRAKVEALHDLPFPGQYGADPIEWFVYPTSFISRSLGQKLEAEVTVGELQSGWSQQPLDVNLAPETNSLLSLNPWPVPDFRGAGQMGRTLQPVMASHKLTTQALTWTGRTLLLSVMNAPGSALSAQIEPAFIYTFLRAGLDGEKHAPATGSPPQVVTQRRLHALTFRLPRENAAALLLSSNADDAELYATLRGMVTDGSASLTDHSAVLCREGHRSLSWSHAAVSYPNACDDLIPQEWFELNPGSRLETEFGKGRDPDELHASWEIALLRGAAPEAEPFHPSAKHPALHGAQMTWVDWQFQTGLVIPASGVLCAAAVTTSPGTEDESAMEGTADVTLLVQSPPPAASAGKSPEQTFLQAAILSIPAGKGAALKRDASASLLIERFLTGEVACPAHAAINLPGSWHGKVSCQRHVPHPVDFHPARANEEANLPAAWEHWACGLTFEADWNLEGKFITVSGTFEWETAPAESLGEPGAKIPEDFHNRRCTQHIKLENIRLTRNQPVIADVRASNAREGTPEHGRWHVLVLLAR